MPTTYLALTALYLAQGLPSGLFAHALPVLWREAGVALGWIGALKLLALPWVLKAIWSPWVDRSLHRGTTPARWIGWLQLSAAGLLLVLAAIGLTPSGGGVWGAAALIMAINLLMATQDIITDGLAVRWLPAHRRGLANAIQVAGYKVGMLAGGALLLMLAAQTGASEALLFPAAMLLVLYIAIRRLSPLRQPVASTGKVGAPLREGLSGLLRQPGIWPWLGILASYKVADAMASGMTRPLLSDAGWTTQAIGTFTLVSTLVGLVGAALGGWLYQCWGSRRSLILTGLAQAATIAAWALVTPASATTALVYSVGLLEQLADGASTVALFAVMMSLCRKGWEGTDFTVQASIQVVFAGLFGLAGGLLAGVAGYPTLFAVAALAGAGVILALALKTRHRQLS
ncbi:MFS transporter [Marinobacter sp. SS21]|uniref:MFS transporter n=1 Tax=Marinobacter sp. SS21 TaxID=2979460 RepID=UPI0023311B92|nr:MFS transporter [Marinobacter sp. SS21]